MKLLFCLLSLFAVTARATPWSVGAALDRDSGLSVQYKLTAREAIHVTTQFFQKDFISLEGHLQKFYYPYWYGLYELGFYTGFGVAGEAYHEEIVAERYYLAIPVGAQWNSVVFPLEAFGEVAAVMGDLPNTAMRGRARLGLRTNF